MSSPQGPKPPPTPETIHRTEASQTEVDLRMAAHALNDRSHQPDAGPPRTVSLLAELVDTQKRLLDGQMEQTRLLQEILQVVSGQRP